MFIGAFALEREATVWSEMKAMAAAQFREWRGKSQDQMAESPERERARGVGGKARHHR